MDRFITGIFATAFALSMQAKAAAPNHKHLGTIEQQQHALEWNRAHKSFDAQIAGWPVSRPFSEIENTGFVAVSGADEAELPDLRAAIAKNLPAGVTLIVYVNDSSEIPPLQTELGTYLNADRLKFLVISMNDDGDPLWARDSLPFPVYLNNAGKSSFGLVGSIYPQDFDPNASLAKALGLPLTSTGQVFRGGNLLLDLSGNCFSENVNEVASLNDPVGFFTNFFGCKSVTLLDKQGGIGDIDERIKFLNDQDALTDSAVYQTQLKAKGYTVHMIPGTGNDMETYMNTLIVNGTIFVPQMGIPADKDAIAAYQALGFNAIGVYTKLLADDDEGNIHCLTMNYPPGTFVPSVRGASIVEFAPGMTLTH